MKLDEVLGAKLSPLKEGDVIHAIDEISLESVLFPNSYQRWRKSSEVKCVVLKIADPWVYLSVDDRKEPKWRALHDYLRPRVQTSKERDIKFLKSLIGKR